MPFERFDSGRFGPRRANEGSRGSATSIAWGTLGTTRTVIDGVVIVAPLLVIVPVEIPIALGASVLLFLMSRRSNQIRHRFAWDLTEDDRHRGCLAQVFCDRDTEREVRMFDLGRWLGEAHSTLWGKRLVRLRRVVWTRVRNAAVGSLASSTMIAAALGLVAWLAATGNLSLADAGVGILGVHRLAGATAKLNTHTANHIRAVCTCSTMTTS